MLRLLRLLRGWRLAIVGGDLLLFYDFTSLPLGCKNRFEDSNATELQGILCTFANGFLIDSLCEVVW